MEDLAPVIEAHGLEAFIQPVHDILQNGNMAMRWIAAHEAGQSVPEIIEAAIRESAEKDLESAQTI
jgi:gamma-glutamyl:cysteine ligase YbdK (ATP-grasp superfamily)